MDDLPAWLEVALGFVAIGVAVGLFLLDRRNRWLSYAILSSRAVVNPLSNFNIEVRHAGAVVNEPRLIVWRIANGGTSAIEPGHYEEPISLHMDHTQVLAAELTYSRPSSFTPTLKIVEQSAVAIEQRLMNPNDMIEVQVLVDGTPSAHRAESRIAGVTEIRRATLPSSSLSEPWRFRKRDFLPILFPIAAVAGLGLYMMLAGDSTPLFDYFGLTVFCFGVVVFPWMVWRRERLNKLFLA